MKNAIKKTKKGILMVALLATVTGFAKDTNALIKSDAKKTSLILKNVKQGNVLTLKDAYGIVLFKESIEDNGVYKKGFDLTKLPDGDYVFELEKDLEIKTIPFSVDLNNVSFDTEDEVTYFKPYIKEEEDLVFFTKLNLNRDKITVDIYSNIKGDYKLLHTETFDNVKVIEKVFKLEKGSYKIVTNSNNKEYTTLINN